MTGLWHHRVLTLEYENYNLDYQLAVQVALTVQYIAETAFMCPLN